MNHWGHVVVEGYCTAPEEPLPCGRVTVSYFCITSGMCPYFGYCRSSPRESAIYLPLHKMLWDKMTLYSHEVHSWLHWNLYGRWTFQSMIEPVLEKDSEEYEKAEKWRKEYEEQARAMMPNFETWLSIAISRDSQTGR